MTILVFSTKRVKLLLVFKILLFVLLKINFTL